MVLPRPRRASSARRPAPTSRLSSLARPASTSRSSSTVSASPAPGARAPASNVWALGLASLFNDISSEMIFPLLPIFLTSILGVGTALVGLIEGMADSAASLLDLFIGYWSDRRARRKEFVLAGYAISSISKLFIALSTLWPLILIGRVADRLGKSVRTAPRDALIAASSTPATRGRAFGLHRALDTTGAIIGPLLAYLILSAMGSTQAGYQTVFLLAAIPAFLVLLVIHFQVREPATPRARSTTPARSVARRPGFWASLRHLPDRYKRFLAVSCLFSLSYFSFALLILRASQIGLSAPDILLVYALYNIVYALASIPVGRLSDAIGRKPVIAASMLLYGLVLVGFAYVSSLAAFALLFCLYGLFVAADESVNKAYIADLAGEKSRGLAMGTYSSAVGAAYLPASALFGLSWAALGAVPTFLGAALLAGISAGLLALWAE